MPILDDEQFERYLKEFRPLAPESLRTERQRSGSRRPFVVMAWSAACAVSLLLAFLWWHRPRSPQQGSVPQVAASQSLTIGRANALLTHAPSLNKAFDELSFQPKPASQPEGKQSALAVLGKENIKR